MSPLQVSHRYRAAEQREIERHYKRLCNERDCGIEFEEAEADWLEHHAMQWRVQRQTHCLALQREEINRHKWIRSEQEKRDVGHEAVFEWIQKYAAAWRQWYEEEHGVA